MGNTGNVLATAQQYYSPLPSPPGIFEQNPEEIWNAFIKTIATITVSLQFSPSCICLSSCMHGLLVLNNEHKPLTNFITWADARSNAVAEALRNKKLAKAIYNATGTPIHAMLPLCKIIWLRKNLPAVFKAADRFISIKEFIWHRLFKVFEIDYALASATGFLNNKKLQWYFPSLRLAGVTTSQLSEPVPTTFLRAGIDATHARLLGISSTTAFCIGASDGCLANVGSDSLTKGVAAVTIGTSGAVRIANKKPLSSFATMNFSYLLTEKIFICGAPTSNGGNVLQWLQNNFLEQVTANHEAVFKKAAEISAGSEGLLFLPYIHGERAPVWDEKASGVFFGVTAMHRQATFIRATLEGVCYSILSIVGLLEKKGAIINQLNVSGGFTQSEIWLQMLADVTGKKICLAHSEDASAKGAAIFGMVAIKILPALTSLPASVGKIFYPNQVNNKIYRAYYPIYQTLYGSLKKPMHQLYHFKK